MPLFYTASWSRNERPGADAILAEVKKTVLALNTRNDKCDRALIDTGQRGGAATAAGLDAERDITEA